MASHRLSGLRSARACDLALRASGSAWFLLLALVMAREILPHALPADLADFVQAGWAELIAAVCLCLFYLALWWFILVRPAPVAMTEGALPSVVAFAGTYLPWAMVLVAPHSVSTSRNIGSAALLLIGSGLMVVVIAYLGRSFSIVPQARKLVRTGPYAIVRNPLYLAEEVAVLGTALQFWSLLTLLLFVAHCALQIGRMFYEENLLRRSFPEYDDYAKSTFRLIPYVW